MSQPRQLAFDLPVRRALGRADFFVAPCNQLALAQLDGWARWPDGRLVLAGPTGSGKTHLAHVWATQSGARIIEAQSLTPKDACEALVVENADEIGENEAALFHVYNQMQAMGGALLITGKSAPSRWGLGLADLSSRLESMPLVALEPPDDALLSMIMVKLFDDRQLPVSPKVLAYVLKRVGRSYGEINALVAALDKAALAAGGPLTVPLASAYFKSLDAEA